MPGCSITQTWVTNIENIQKQYTIKLLAHVQCCATRMIIQIFVNGEEIQHELIDNPCSPLCGETGRYQWQMSGHNFLLMGNNTLTWSHKKYRLFIDGIDCNTGMEFSAFWRKRGWIFSFLGAVMMILGVIGLVFIFIYEHYQDSVLRPAITFIVIGGMLLIFGLITVLKFRKPLIYENIGCINTY